MRLWVFFYLHCFLLGSLVDSTSLSSIITSQVGDRVVLPCSWKPRLGEAAPSTCHVQWTKPSDTVFEQRGQLKWQAEELDGRAEVPEEKLGSGDCSLIIRDVQILDGGYYESFMVVDGVRSKRTRVFIQSVKLSVFDHKSLQYRGPGEDMVLDLYTRHSVRVVFQGRNSSEWSVLWARDDDDERLQRNPVTEQLTMKRVTRSDEGTYKVMDEHGLAVSTVQLFVTENSAQVKDHRVNRDYQVQTDDAASISCSALLSFLLLLILHLL